MKRKKLILNFLALMGGLVIVSCSDTEEYAAMEQDTISSTELTIENNFSLLNARVTLGDQDIPVISPTNGRVMGDVTLIQKASIQAPEINGSKIMATSLDISGNDIAVGYNTAGVIFAGGVDLLNRDKDELEMTSQISLDASDISMVSYDGNDLFFVGGSPTSDSVAFIDVVEVKNGEADQETYERIRLGGYMSTSIARIGDNMFVTTGNSTSNGGGLYVINRNSHEVESYLPINDARWVMAYESYAVVLGANPGLLTIVDKSSFELVSSFEVDGLVHDQTKSTFDMDSKYVYVAAGYDGVNIYDISSGDMVGNIPLPDDQYSAEMFANSVTIENKKGYMACGEAVFMFEFDDKKDLMGVEVVGRLDLGDNESINHVIYRSGYLMVASGQGGTKLIEVSN
jgi:hypothetical protein